MTNIEIEVEAECVTAMIHKNTNIPLAKIRLQGAKVGVKLIPPSNLRNVIKKDKI